MGRTEAKTMKAIIICKSFHKKNTQMIAEEIAQVLDCEIKPPESTSPHELVDYDLIGFASGIYRGQFHASILNLVEELGKELNEQPNKQLDEELNEELKGEEKEKMKEKLDEKKEKEEKKPSCFLVSTSGFRPLPIFNNYQRKIKNKVKQQDLNLLGCFTCRGHDEYGFLKHIGGLYQNHPSPQDRSRARKFAKKMLEEFEEAGESD